MKKRILPFLLLITYLFILIKILVLKDLAMVRVGHLRLNFGGTQEGAANLIPFKTIFYYLQGHNGFLIAGINILGNIIALVPFGILVPFLFQNINWNKIIILSIITGLAIETTQFVLHIGIFDIDDVILNAMGVLIGFWKFNIFSNFSKTAKSIVSAIVLSILGVFILLFTLSYYKIIEMPIGIESSTEREPLPMLQNNSAASKDCCDLCNGTGGTGKILSISENAIIIKSRKGKDELIHITPKTEIKNSNGIIAKTILKIGDQVTVVIDETETASLILVCGIAEK
jgi:glycopeptide antibiotics resistance protein